MKNTKDTLNSIKKTQDALNALIEIGKIPGIIKEKTGRLFTRQTIYRWINEGKQIRGTPIKLQAKKICGQLFSKEEWINLFLEGIS